MPNSLVSGRSPRPCHGVGRLPLLGVALVLVCGLVAGAAFAPGVRAQDATGTTSSDVWMFRGNSMRTGLQPGPAPQGSPVVRWIFQTGGSVRSSPAIAGGAAFFGSKDGNVYAVDLATGQERWRFPTGGPVVSSPAVKNGVVYVGSQDGYFYAIDAANGEHRWSYHFYTAGSPTISGDLLFVTTTGNTLHAIDLATGLERWHAAFSFSVTEPAVAGQSVYVGADGLIQAFDKNTGLVRWVYDVDGTASASVIVTLGRVYAIVTQDESVGEVEVESGSSEGTEESDAPTADKNNDAGGGGVAASSSRLYAIDAEDGLLRWSYAVPGDREQFSSMAMVDGVMYVGSGRGWLYAIDPNTGRQLWGYQTNGAVIASPVVAEGQLFIGSYGGGFHVLDAQTGAVRWIQDAGAPIGSSAAVVDGVVYVGTDGGSLVAIAGSGAPAELPTDATAGAPTDDSGAEFASN